MGEKGVDVPHPGISPEADLEPGMFLLIKNRIIVISYLQSSFSLCSGTEKKYHKYYQWVCFVIFLEAIAFSLPRFLWKSAEGGRVRMLVEGE